MTPDTGPSPLTVARRRDVDARRTRVAQALEAMRKEGSEVTISSVAARARVHRSFIHRHPDLRADVYAAAAEPMAAATATMTTRKSLEADSLNLRATVHRQAQHIADLEARLSELLGEQAYSRTGLGAPHDHAALEEQNQILQNESRNFTRSCKTKKRNWEPPGKPTANSWVISTGHRRAMAQFSMSPTRIEVLQP